MEAFGSRRGNFPNTPKAEILSLDVNSLNVATTFRAHIVASFDDGSIVAWSMPSAPEGVMETHFSIVVGDHIIPRTVRFQLPSIDLLVFSVNGEVYVVR